VAECPSTGQTVQCPNNTCPGLVSSYNTTNTIHRLGGICEPTDAGIKEKFWQDTDLNQKRASVHGWEVAVIALIIGACVGLLYMVAFIVIPKIMTYLAFILSAIVLLTAGILLIVQPVKLLAFQGNTLNIILGIIFIILAILLALLLWIQDREIELASIFLVHSNTFLKDKYVLFAYIPLFMLFSFGLFVLCVWQYIAFGSVRDPNWTASQVYKQISQNTFLQVLNFIEFVWGIQFIRDSFNYIISGNAVEWYFNYNNNQPTSCGRPFTRLLCKNWGSVAAGAFLNAFFNIFGIIIDFFRVSLYSYSATPRVVADEPANAAKMSAVVAPVFSTWPEPTPTPTFI
jgi:hypothetical protein